LYNTLTTDNPLQNKRKMLDGINANEECEEDKENTIPNNSQIIFLNQILNPDITQVLTLVRYVISEKGIAIWFRKVDEVYDFQFGPLRSDGLHWFFKPKTFPAELKKMAPSLGLSEMDISQAFTTGEAIECFLPVSKPLNVNPDSVIVKKHPDTDKPQFICFYVPFGNYILIEVVDQEADLKTFSW
jgi:hypothetical protein